MKLTITKIPLNEFTVVSHGYDDAADVLVKYVSLATGVNLPIETISQRNVTRYGSALPRTYAKG